jgi:leucyl aminopeptidase (aminopeptidase T)
VTPCISRSATASTRLFPSDAIDAFVPEDRTANESATHQDLILDVSEDSRIDVDGEVVQRDGTFVFEESGARTE